MKLGPWIPVAVLIFSQHSFAGRLGKSTFHVEGGEKNMVEFHGSKEGVSPAETKPMFEVHGLGMTMRDVPNYAQSLSRAALEEFNDVRSKAARANAQNMGEVRPYDVVYASFSKNERKPVIGGARIDLDLKNDEVNGLVSYQFAMPESSTRPFKVSVWSGNPVLEHHMDGHKIDVFSNRKFTGFSSTIEVEQAYKVEFSNGEAIRNNPYTQVSVKDPKSDALLRQFSALVSRDNRREIKLHIFDGKNEFERKWILNDKTPSGEPLTGNVIEVRPNSNLSRLTVVTDTGQEVDYTISLRPSYLDGDSDIRVLYAGHKNNSELWQAARAEMTDFPSQRTGSAINKSKHLGEGVPASAEAAAAN